MTTREKMSGQERDGVLSSASSCISEAVYGDGVLSSASSCMREEFVVEVSDDDRQLLCLLDAMDHLLRCREALAKSLSKGWMEITSARYSMGPSRIDQTLFSLKPCSPSLLVSISRSEDFAEGKRDVGEDEQDNDTIGAFQYSLQSSSKCDQDNYFASREHSTNSRVFSHSNLRQRHTLGLEDKDHIDDNSEGAVNHLLAKGRDLTQDGHTNSKQSSDALAWFGTLVSPHLRIAQTSFTEALRTLVDLASAQSKMLSAYHKIKRGESI